MIIKELYEMIFNWRKKRMMKERNKIMKEAVFDLEYNCKNGVGSIDTPFKIDSICKLANADLFENDIVEHAREICDKAYLCYRRPIKFSPGSIKTHCQEILRFIRKTNEH